MGGRWIALQGMEWEEGGEGTQGGGLPERGWEGGEGLEMEGHVTEWHSDEGVNGGEGRRGGREGV